jgi:hypothetical protein
MNVVVWYEPEVCKRTLNHRSRCIIQKDPDRREQGGKYFLIVRKSFFCKYPGGGEAYNEAMMSLSRDDELLYASDANIHMSCCCCEVWMMI